MLTEYKNPFKIGKKNPNLNPNPLDFENSYLRQQCYHVLWYYALSLIF